MSGLASWAGILLAAIPALTNLGIAIYVLARMRRNAVTYAFALFVLAMTTWQASEACTRTVDTLRQAEACRGILFAGGLLVAPLGMHFALLFTDRRHLARSPLLLMLLYGPALVFEALNRAGFNEARLVQNPVWGWQHAPPPPVVSVFSSYWVILLTFGTLIVLMRFAHQLPRQDARKRQARLVAGGLALPLLVGASLQVVLPTVFRLPSIPLTSVSLTLFSLAVVVALRHHQFLATPTIEERLEEAQQTMRRQSELLAQAERVADLGSWEWDVQANEVRWSKQLYRLFDVVESELEATYEGYLECVHPEDRDMVDGAVWTAMEERRGFTLDHRVLRRDGSERIIHARGRAHLDDEGRVVRMTGTAHDVTEQRKAHQARSRAESLAQELDRLEELDQIKTRFINAAAHELYTPLTPMRTMLAATRKKAEKAGYKELLGSIDLVARNAERLQGLVRDLLDASRLDADKVGLHLQAIDVAGIVSDVVETFEAEAETSGIRLDADAEPGLTVLGDADRLTQVLVNLVSNAIKFTRPGGTVHVEARSSGADVVLLVEDTGTGMSVEAIEALFEPFSRVHDESEYRVPGVGLGLYICKRIVDLHGGKIDCRSDGPGQGSTFTVTLPTTEVDTASASESA